MVNRLLLTTLLLSASHLLADTPKKETSLFLEYEREVSRQNDPIADQDNPFIKKVITKLTPTKPATPYVHVPVAPVVTAQPTLPEKPSIGHDTLPYLVINKPVDPTPVCIDKPSLVESPAVVKETKKSLFENLASKKDRVLAKAREFLGTPYGFGTKDGYQTDCSGFTQQVFRQFGVSLPRSAAEQAKYGTEVATSDLQVGDLMFYQTYKSEPSHVAIYAGDGKIIHASYTNRRVQYDAIDKGYYKQRFMYAKRIALKNEDSSSE